MQGEWTPYTELSPENLARAVWDALATQFNDAGTMGNKLNAASSGSTAPSAESIAAAGLAAAQITPIHADLMNTHGQTIIGTGVEADKFRSHRVG